MKIYKYEIDLIKDVNPASQALVEMPIGAKVLSVGSQKANTVCLWARVNTLTREKESRRFRIIGTGQECFRDIFIGTVEDKDGVHIWHVFEV